MLNTLLVFSCSTQIVNYLLENGAELEMKDITGRTALHRALEWEKIDIVKVLIRHGANFTTEYKGCIFVVVFSCGNDVDINT